MSKKIVCDKCHKACEDVLSLRIGNGGLGLAVARDQHREPNYYDGLIDGLREAILVLRSEGGLYWKEVGSQCDEKEA